VVPDPNGETRVIALALKRLRELSETERENSRKLRVLDIAAFEASLPSAT
jgi:hypothetical protein